MENEENDVEKMNENETQETQETQETPPNDTQAEETQGADNKTVADIIAEIKAEYAAKIDGIKADYAKQLKERDDIIKALYTGDGAYKEDEETETARRMREAHGSFVKW